MALKLINIGITPNDGTGDNLRAAGTKINDNFQDVSVVGVVGTKEVDEASIADTKILQYNSGTGKLEYVALSSGLWQDTGTEVNLISNEQVVIQGDTTGGVGNVLTLKDSVGTNIYRFEDDGGLIVKNSSVAHNFVQVNGLKEVAGTVTNSWNGTNSIISLMTGAKGYNNLTSCIVIGDVQMNGSKNMFDTVIIGKNVLRNISLGSDLTNSVMLGIEAAGGNDCVSIGYNTGNAGKNNNVFIGANAGRQNTTGNRFMVTLYTGANQTDQQNRSLIWGVFDPITANQEFSINASIFNTQIKTGATQVAAGASASEIWKTASHVTLPDNVLMIGV